MDLTPSDEQVMLGDMVRRFLADRQNTANMGRGPIPRDDWRALGELGLFSFLLPETAGGMGGRPQDAVIIAEELGRSMAITPLAETVLLCAGLIARRGSAGQIARWVQPVMQGEYILAYAGGGAIRYDGACLDGQTHIVQHGMDASAFVVALPERQGAVLVSAAADGLTRTPVRLADGTVAAEVRFDAVAADPLEATANDLDTAIAHAELATIAEMIGTMTTLYEQTVDYIQQRRQFGVAIGSFQVIQHRAARLFVMLEQSRSMMLKAALVEEDERIRMVTAAKAYVADAALRLAQDATQLHGGMGVTDELPVGRGHRRLLVLSHLFGGALAARARLAS
ncbi:MAG: acyl-CoA dehydrogenase [Rhodospirillaceae bacterium]|nr:MAG: acyl-CoA dehydrogenase [Rhodospirillaceae bacterium]